ncbi:tRNA adenosine(34) deaminase TadA [Desulfolucanica intricata]|uniref:tRNA adenosine(34) deaminase TadA n=1 Tax=Desulfolucanica intricata TaxID=1285191 RepID=UPI001A9A5351|nr:tRNA adenosine(34) deaminase TadA [Desulfolucanica intricata]
MDHARFMQEALIEAKKAYTKGEVPIGAVSVYQDQIISRGHNLRETLCDSTAHAEIIALKKAARYLGDWRLNEVTLYSTIEPCVMCAGALIQFRVKLLVYGAPDIKFGAVDSGLNVVRQARFNHRVEVISGIMEDECKEIIQRFFRELRKSKKLKKSKLKGEMAELVEGARLEIE